MPVSVHGNFDAQAKVASIFDDAGYGKVMDVFGYHYQRTEPDCPTDYANLFEIGASLPPGDYAVVPHFSMPDQVGIGGNLRFTVRTVDERCLLEETMQINSVLASNADSMVFEFKIDSRSEVRISASSNRLSKRIFMRMLELYRMDGSAPAKRASFDHEPTFSATKTIKEVLIGTTSVCNAACIHCPTNKKMLSHLGSGVMAPHLYEKIVQGLAEYDGKVEKLCFGLFAEPFMDPHIIDRFKFAKLHLPHISIEIATNAAAYDADKHRDTFQYASGIAVHVESVTPAIYNDLMRPLKLETALPKVREFVSHAREAGVATWLTSPVHRKNAHEMSALRNFANELGVPFSAGPIANRCTDTLQYDKLNLAPVASTCRQDITDGLVIDWDGAVLSCCIDFQKRTILGDLQSETVSDVMGNRARREFHELLQNGYWNKSESCRNCLADSFDVVRDLIPEIA